MSCAEFIRFPLLFVARFDNSMGMDVSSKLSDTMRSMRTLLPMTPTVVNRMRMRRIAPWIAGIVTILLLIGTLMIGKLVRDSMRSVTHESIRSVLSANLAALEIWSSERLADVQRSADRQELRASATQLIAKHSGQSPSAERLANDPLTEVISEQVPETLSNQDYLGWAVLDLNCNVLASNRSALVSKRLPIPSEAIKSFEQLKPVLARPFASPGPLEESGPMSTNTPPVMAVIAPFKQQRRCVGSLVFLINPLQRFSKIMRVARVGTTGETYAFDRQGVLLTQSLFENDLRRAGLLDRNKNIVSPLNIQLRDPGVDIRVAKVDPTTVSNAKLTLMADQATRGGSGSNLTGYNNYRGADVIGSWVWIPKYSFGIATEIGRSEAYGPMSILTNSFLGLIGLIMVASVGLFSFSSALRWFAEHGPQTDRLRRLGQYNLGESIGHGGMGAVYHARHEFLRRDVAVKVLEEREVTPRSLSRFEREVRLTAQLRHPNTIDIYDYGRSEEGTFFYVMEYVDGISLQQLVDEYGPLSTQRVIYLLQQICGSLAEAHDRSMVHRDVKPANVLLTSQAGLYDMIKVFDFGLVKEIDEDNLQLTQSASITGTPLYMSPEVVRDASAADSRSDIYSLGAVAYFLLTGHSPFSGGSPADVCVRQLNEMPPRPQENSASHLPDDIQDIIMKCLEKNPSFRPQNMNELSEALAKCNDAHDWTIGEARLWWEETYRGPRDEMGDIADNGQCNDTESDAMMESGA